MPDKKLTDSDIVKERKVSLKEQIEHYNKRQKEVFDKYYRRNTKGNEDTLEICVLRESAVLISKLESIINRLQAENERLKEDNETLKSCIAKSFVVKAEGENPLSYLKAEAYKECIEKVKERSSKMELVCSGALVRTDYTITKENLDNLLKEKVGEDNES